MKERRMMKEREMMKERRMMKEREMMKERRMMKEKEKGGPRGPRVHRRRRNCRRVPFHAELVATTWPGGRAMWMVMEFSIRILAKNKETKKLEDDTNRSIGYYKCL